MTTVGNEGQGQTAATVWCGIPVYNNAATIHDVARRCRAMLPHVVVIDDGSTDADLRDLLHDLDVTVIRHPVNRGKGIALLTAFEHVRSEGGEYLISLDGDGQHYPEDLPAMLPALSPDTIVVGYRDEVTGVMPKRSQIGRDFSDFWIGLETGHAVRDTQSGFRAYPVAAMAKLSLMSDRYHFEMEVVTRAIWAGLRCTAVPVRVKYPTREERVSSFDPVRDNFRIGLLHTHLMLRQLLPIPHKQIVGNDGHLARRRFADLMQEHPTPATLALACGLNLLMGIVLWPYAPLIVIYLGIRFHLNKIIALLCSAVTLMPFLPQWSRAIGHDLVDSPAHPGLEWFVGSHVVALLVALPAAIIVYGVARAVSRREST